MECKYCKHKIEKLGRGTFLEKYKDGSRWCHVRHRWNRFNPLRECHCGCKHPEPLNN